MRRVLTITLLFCICGCRATQHPVSADRPPGVWPPDYASYHPAGDPAFTPEESRAVNIAKQYLISRATGSADAYYRPRKAEGGFEVIIAFLDGYDEAGHPIFSNVCSGLVISRDWQVMKYIRY